jgi:Cu/Ag efflux protein CusF
MKKALLAIVTALCLLALVAAAQQAKGRQHTLKGTVTEVGKDRLTVEHGNIAGYMAAMTMPYKVDKADVLTKVKKGDSIEATVYEDDYTLYDVKVVPPRPARK